MNDITVSFSTMSTIHMIMWSTVCSELLTVSLRKHSCTRLPSTKRFVTTVCLMLLLHPLWHSGVNCFLKRWFIIVLTSLDMRQLSQSWTPSSCDYLSRIRLVSVGSWTGERVCEAPFLPEDWQQSGVAGGFLQGCCHWWVVRTPVCNSLPLITQQLTK